MVIHPFPRHALQQLGSCHGPAPLAHAPLSHARGKSASGGPAAPDPQGALPADQTALLLCAVAAAIKYPGKLLQFAKWNITILIGKSTINGSFFKVGSFPFIPMCRGGETK